MTEEITQALLKQLAQQQAEIEKLEKENKKLKSNGGIVLNTMEKGIFPTPRKNGKTAYGFYVYDENHHKIKREGFKTKKEARDAKREMLNLRDQNKLATHAANRKQTFNYFCESYIAKAEADFAINTVEAAKGIIKNHLNFFKDIPIVKCKKNKAQEWSNMNRKMMKPYAFNNTLKLAKAVWNHAVSTDLTTLDNPFSHIKPINIKKECETREAVRIDKMQADIILATAKGMFKDTDYIYPAIAVASYALLREGEIFGLFWSDIDFKNNAIFIQRQLQKITKKKLKQILLENPNLTEKDILLTNRLKTGASKVKIPMTQPLADILKEYKKKLMANSQLHELCFCKDDGNPIVAHDFVKYKFKKVLKNAFGDKEFMHFHELRGSGATILHMEGTPSKLIQALLRHEKLATTEDIYMNVDGKFKEMSEHLNRVFTA